MQVLWFVPTHGDGRYLGTSHRGRATDLSYMRQIVQAADRLGYAGVLLPTGRSCEDAWIVASSLILSGYPHLEEAYRFAELTFPLLPLEGADGGPKRVDQFMGPFGEALANSIRPSALSGTGSK